ADLGRIQGQQRFIRALLNKVKSLGVLLNPLTLIKLSETAGHGLIFDKGINLGLARSIANSLKFDNKNVDFRQYPGTPQYIGGVSYVVGDPAAARALFRALADNTALPDVGKTGQSLPSPGDVSIKLINASGVNGFASRERTKLVAKGFQVPTITTSSQNITPTIITYQAGGELKAELVAIQFPGATLRLATSSQFTDIVVTLGHNAAAPAPSGSATAKSAPKPSTVGLCS
ncbi:MAG TPA: LCP family protein, partial [Actinomycetota bacterium]|nr:LCP family protein [Actinomycetota bacterium]